MSDDVLGKATIMLVADQGGFTADMATAARTVGQFESAAVQASSNAATALTSIGTASSGTADTLSKSQKTFVESLQRQVAAMEGGKLAALELKAQQMGLADSVAPLIERMRQVEAAQKAAAAASAESAASHAAAVGAVVQLAESEEEATARIRTMVATSLEQTDALNKQNTASREAATAARELAGASGATAGGARIDFSAQQRELQQTANEVAEVNRALNSIGQGASSMKEVEAQTEKLLTLWQSGRISAEQYDAAVKQLDASEASLGKASAAAAAQADQFIGKLRDQAAVASMTSKQLLEYRAAQMGVSDKAAPLIDKISADAATAQMNQFIAKLREQASVAGMTSKQLLEYRAAQLGVADKAAPFIEKISAGSEAMHSFSLESGGARRELAVVARELARGDFGSAARSLSILSEKTGLTAMLMSPLGIAIGVTAAAVAALGYEAYKSNERLEAINKAIVSSGNYAGLTADQISAMSAQLAGSTHFIGDANDALTGLVSTGHISGGQLADFGQVALEMAKDTGKSIADVTTDLGALADDAVAWAEKYQKQHHFMSAAQYELAVQYADTGDKAGAARVVIDALHDAHQRMTDDAVKNIGLVQTMWNGWKTIIMDVDQLLGRALSPATFGDQMQAAQSRYLGDMQRLANLQNTPGGGNAQLVAQMESKIAADRAELVRINDMIADARKKAQDDQNVGKSGDRAMALHSYLNDTKNASQADRQRIERDNENKAFAAATEGLEQGSKQYEDAYARHKANLKKIDESYRDKSAKAYTDDAGTRMLQSLREQDASLQAQLAGQNKLTDAQKAQAQFEQQIADIKGKKILTADQKSLLANEAAINAQLQENVAQAEKLRLKQEMEKLDQRSAQIDEAMRASLQGQQEQYSRTLDAFGMGKSAQEQVTALNQIQKEYQRYQEQLTKATPKDLLGTKQFQEDQDKIKAGLADSLKAYQDYYDQLRDKQGDWRTGAMQAFYDYQESARNVASQTQSAFASAFKGMEDAAVSFAMTGKLSFSDLARSVIADIVRIQARASIADASSGLLGSLFGSGTMLGNLFGTSSVSPATVSAANASDDPIGALIASFDGHAVGGYISGPGTGTSDSITARLSNGEFVNTAESTRKNRKLLEWLNNGGDAANMPRFATGGLVGSASVLAAASGAGAAPQVNIINQTSTPMQATATRNADGGIDVLVRALEDRIAGNLASGQGSLYKTFRSGFGMKRTVA